MPVRFFQSGKKKTWWVRGTVHGPKGRAVEVYESTRQTSEKLRDRVWKVRETELVEELVFGKRVSVSFSDGADIYRGLEPRAARTHTIVGKLKDHFGTTPIARIDQQAADEAADEICGADAEPATKRRTVYGPLTAIMRACAKRDLCGIPNFDQPSVGDQETPWLTPIQARALIDAAAYHLRPLLTFLLCTGARLSEALELDWADVDLAAAKAVLRRTKGKRGKKRDRAAALPPACVAVLAAIPARAGRVFLRDDGGVYRDTGRQEGGQIKSAWRTACRKAGLPGHWVEAERRRHVHWRTKAGNRRGTPTTKLTRIWVPDHSPHDCRHSWASWFYSLSKDPLLLKDEGGWREMGMIERYAHLMPSDMVADVALVWGPSHPRIGKLPERIGRPELRAVADQRTV